MIKLMVSRSTEVIRNEGIKGFFSFVKSCLLWDPLLDRFWYMINYYLRPSRKAIKKVQGTKMLLDLRDKGINKDLFLYGYREPECTKIFKKELFEGMKIVDIGANIGYYVLIEAQFIGNSGKIYAIEPEPMNFIMLQKNVEINSYLSRVEFYNMAISNKTGKVLFALSPQSNHHRLSISASSEENVIEVDSTTLDDFAEDKEIDVLRMDTEGAEWVIFKGMNRILSSNKPLKMFIEIHPKLINQYGGDVEKMLKTLAENGFKLKYLVMWEPVPNSLIPYIKGRGGQERKIEFNMPLKDLLHDEKARQVLLCTSGHIYEGGYKVFLERR